MLLVPFLAAAPALNVHAHSDGSHQIIYFHGNGCPHCAVVDRWLEENDIWSQYSIDDREIYDNPANAQYFNEVMGNLGIPLQERGVPAMVFGEKIIGGDKPIIEGFEAAATEFFSASSDLETNGNDQGHEESTELIATDRDSDPEAKSDSELSLWVIISASLVDAINPCAFAVLIILLSTVAAKKDKRKSLQSGLAFTGAIFISYMLMGLGLYSAVNAAGITEGITVFAGVLAIMLGLFNLKDFLWYGKLFKVEVPEAWRPKMKALITSITKPSTAFLIGFAVSLFLLPCTSGPYIVVLGLLAENPLDMLAIFYLLLYNLIFVSPMLALTWVAYKGADIQKLEYYRQANLERLHLIAGLILLGLGLYILFLY